MAFPSLTTFYLGLFLIVLGTGLLKGNVSVIVGQLYGRATSGATPASRSSTWGSTSARSSRRWSAGISGSASTGTSASPRRRRHDARRHSVRAGRQVPRRRRPAARASRSRRSRGRRAAAQRVDLRRLVARRCSRCSAAGMHRRRCRSPPTQIADAAGYFLLILTRGLLRLAVLRRRLDAGGAQAALRRSASSSSPRRSSGRCSSRPARR